MEKLSILHFKACLQMQIGLEVIGFIEVIYLIEVVFINACLFLDIVACELEQGVLCFVFLSFRVIDVNILRGEEY